jgi:hypothetical protein
MFSLSRKGNYEETHKCLSLYRQFAQGIAEPQNGKSVNTAGIGVAYVD